MHRDYRHSLDKKEWIKILEQDIEFDHYSEVILNLLPRPSNNSFFCYMPLIKFRADRSSNYWYRIGHYVLSEHLLECIDQGSPPLTSSLLSLCYFTAKLPSFAQLLHSKISCRFRDMDKISCVISFVPKFLNVLAVSIGVVRLSFYKKDLC